LEVIPFESDAATVVPVEIKVPPCEGSKEGACFVSIQLSGVNTHNLILFTFILGFRVC